MQHIDNLKSRINEQGWEILDAYKLGPFFYGKISKDGEEKEVCLAISSQEELDYLKEIING